MLCPNRLQFWGFLVAEMANIWVETVIAQTLPDLLNTDVRKYGANQILRNSELSTPMVGLGTAVAQLVEALRYKSEGRGFDSRWCHWNFVLT